MDCGETGARWEGGVSPPTYIHPPAESEPSNRDEPRLRLSHSDTELGSIYLTATPRQVTALFIDDILQPCCISGTDAVRVEYGCRHWCSPCKGRLSVCCKLMLEVRHVLIASLTDRCFRPKPKIRRYYAPPTWSGIYDHCMSFSPVPDAKSRMEGRAGR